jgi:hypothetical protein
MTVNEAQKNSVLEVNGRRVYLRHIIIEDLKVLDSSFVFKISIPFAREIKKEDLDRWGVWEKEPNRFTGRDGKPVRMQRVPREWQPIYLQLIVEASLEDVLFGLGDDSPNVPVKEAKIKEISIPEGFTDPENPISEKEIKNMFFVRYISTKEFFKPNKPLEDLMEYGILVGSDISEAIINYGNASQGYPSKIRGNFIRMFYLSASTITTLGYGDIVPITQTARIAVSLEAIFGIMTLGLFLNALSHEMRE